MASRIKDITVEIGGDTTKLTDAITGLELSAKDSARVADLMTQAANSGTIGVSAIFLCK